MRCPKCGFISFDHLVSCSKCGRDIAEAATQLQGTSVKAQAPMFLSGALAAFAEREESFEEHAMEAGADEGIDFHMEMEGEAEEAVAMAGAGEDVDFSFEEEAGAPDISLAEAEAQEAAGVVGEAVDFGAEPAAEEEAAPAEAEESFEELDFMSAADEEEEGGLEFDLEDFLEDMDEDKPKESGADDTSDVDINLDE